MPEGSSSIACVAGDDRHAILRSLRIASALSNEQAHSPGGDLVHSADEFYSPLCRTRTSLGCRENLMHGPADIALDGAIEHLRHCKARVDFGKPGNNGLDEQLNVRAFLRVLKFGRERRLHGATPFMSQHHK